MYDGYRRPRAGLCKAGGSLFLQQTAVAHVQDAVSNRGRLRVMRDHQYRLLELLVRAPQHLQHGIGIGSVEVAGRLIGKNNGGAGNERAGNGNPLLLAARKLRRDDDRAGRQCRAYR